MDILKMMGTMQRKSYFKLFDNPLLTYIRIVALLFD